MLRARGVAGKGCCWQEVRKTMREKDNEWGAAPFTPAMAKPSLSCKFASLIFLYKAARLWRACLPAAISYTSGQHSPVAHLSLPALQPSASQQPHFRLDRPALSRQPTSFLTSLLPSPQPSAGQHSSPLLFFYFLFSFSLCIYNMQKYSDFI